MQTIEEIRRFFEADRFVTENGIVIDEAEDGRAVCSVVLEKRHQNAMGSAQGGLIFTLADFAFAVAANCLNPGTVTLSSSINYLRAPKGKKLTAVCVRSSAGRRTSLYRAEVTDELGTQVAFVTVTGYTVNVD